jgi:hypothetical protein
MRIVILNNIRLTAKQIGMTNKRKKTIESISKYILLSVLTAFLFGSCSEDDIEPEIPVERVLLVYMGGDNNLSSETYEKIEQIRQGWKAGAANRLLIYADPADVAPSLSEIVKNENGNSLRTLSVYQEENSAGSDVLERVIGDMKRLYPSSCYGLLVFSHASGWLPEGSLKTPKSILTDGSSEMELIDFASAIPDRTFDFIVLETCFSAGIEVAYALRDKTGYLLVSSAEIVSPGFTHIYKDAIGHLFEKEGGLEKFGKVAFGYFNAQSGYGRSATFSIIKTKELEKLAAFIYQNCDFSKDVNIKEIQKFDRYSYSLFFDFEDYYSALLETEEQRVQLSGIINECVVWKASTDWFMTGYNGFEITRHSGMTSYIPQVKFPVLNEAYLETSWGAFISK